MNITLSTFWWSDVCVQDIHWTSRDTLTTSGSLVVVRFSLQKKHVRARAYNAPLSDCTCMWAWENETVAHTLDCNQSKSLLKIKLKSCCFDVFQVPLTRDRADRDLEHLRRQHFLWELMSTHWALPVICWKCSDGKELTFVERMGELVYAINAKIWCHWSDLISFCQIIIQYL